MSDTFYATREAYLTAAVKALTPMLATAGATLPPVRVSVGWPGGRRARSNVIGQCWPPTSAADGVQQVYVSPVLADPVDVLSTLLHELCHAADSCEHGHRGAFARYARAVGLQPPMPATTPGDALRAQLAEISKGLGAYPHAALRATSKGVHAPQTTRMLKVTCPACGYVARVSRRWLDDGAPLCPTHLVPMTPS